MMATYVAQKKESFTRGILGRPKLWNVNIDKSKDSAVSGLQSLWDA